MSTPTTWTEMEFRVNDTVIDRTLSSVCDNPVELTDRERHAVRTLINAFLKQRDDTRWAEENGFDFSMRLARASQHQAFFALRDLVQSLTLGSYSAHPDDQASTCTAPEAENLMRQLVAWADQGWE